MSEFTWLVEIVPEVAHEWDRVVHRGGCKHIARDLRMFGGQSYTLHPLRDLAQEYGITDPAEVSALSWLVDVNWSDGEVDPNDHEAVLHTVRQWSGAIHAAPCTKGYRP